MWAKRERDLTCDTDDKVKIIHLVPPLGTACAERHNIGVRQTRRWTALCIYINIFEQKPHYILLMRQDLVTLHAI